MANVTVTTPNRIKVLELINGETPQTRDSLCETLDISKASLASVFTQLRLMGKFPMQRNDKTLYIGTEDEYRAYMEARSANSSTSDVSPEKRRKSLMTTIERCTQTMEKLADVKDDNMEARLRYELAEAKLNLANFELEQLPAPEAPDAAA